MQTNDTTGLCGCGCGQVTNVYRGVHRRFVYGHQWRRADGDYRIDEQTGCWVWQRGKFAAGYGCIGRNTYAHRAFYEEANGPIPEGMELDHLCRNRACVNPDHLEPVTHAVNLQRGPNVRITPEIATEIRALAGTMRQVDIAKKFGIGRSTVANIVRGYTWSNVSH